MTRIQLYSSQSWAAITSEKNEWLTDISGPVLILIPPLWKSPGIRQIFPDSPVLTTVELLERYIRRGYGQSSLLSKPAVEHLLLSVILKDATSDAANSSRFLNIETYFQGYARALTEFIIDFRENGDLNLLDSLNTFKRQALSQKERDLIDIHDELENLLHQRGLFDYRRALLAFIKDKEKGVPEYFLPDYSNATLVLFGFSYVTPLESKLLGRLMYRFPKSIFLQSKNQKAAKPVFHCQKSLNIFLEKVKQVFKNEINEVTKSQSAPTQLSSLADLIFHDEKGEQRFSPMAQIRIDEANNRYNEVTRIAQQICQLHAGGLPYKKMRAVFPNQDLYAALLLEIFPRYQIPYHLTTGTPLKFFPIAQLILNLVNHAIAASPFSLREHIFSSPYVTFSCTVSADAFIKYSGEFENEAALLHRCALAFLNQPKQIFLDYQRLQTLRKRAAKTIQTSENLHPLQVIIQYFKLIYAEDAERQQLEIFKAAAGYFVLTLAEKALYVWRSSMEPDSFMAAIEKLLKIYHIEENIKGTEAPPENISSAIVKQDLRVLESVRELSKRVEAQFLALVNQPGQKFPLADLAHTFISLFNDPDCNVPDEDSDGVNILSPLDAPGEFWPVTFLGGMIDGDFPEREPFNFIQPKNEGQLLTGGLSYVDRDRHALYQLIRSTTKQLFLSYPLSDGGKMLMISPFVTEIRKCFSDEIQSSEANENTLITIREKLVFMGQQIDRSYEQVLPLLKELQKTSSDFFNHIISIFQCDGLRASIDGFSQFDGFFESQNSLNTVQSQMLEEPVYNVEKLERFAGCPLRFLLDDLIQLKPDYLTDYFPDSTERGNLIRTILKDYSRAAAAAGEIPENAGEILQQSATTALTNLLNEKDDLFNARFQHGLVAGLDPAEAARKKRPGLLAAFLRHEKTAPDLLKPYLANISFSKSEVENAVLRLNEMSIEIELDRIDQTLDGKFLMIYNYTVGDLGRVEKIGKGLSFLLPLQILALQEYLKKNQRNIAVGGAGMYLIRNYRNIKRGGYFALKDLQATRKEKVNAELPIYSGQRKYGFLPAINFDEELNSIRERILHIHHQVQLGRFHLPLCAAADQTCQNCHFTRICRKEQLRQDKLYSTLSEKEVYKPLRRLVK